MRRPRARRVPGQGRRERSARPGKREAQDNRVESGVGGKRGWGGGGVGEEGGVERTETLETLHKLLAGSRLLEALVFIAGGLWHCHGNEIRLQGRSLQQQWLRNAVLLA